MAMPLHMYLLPLCIQLNVEVIGHLEQELNPLTMNASSISIHKGMSEHSISSIQPNPYIWFIPSCYIIQLKPKCTVASVTGANQYKQRVYDEWVMKVYYKLPIE